MKKTVIPELSEFDPTKYLDDDEAAVHYIRLAIEDGDPWLLAAALGDVARARGMKQVASSMLRALIRWRRSLGRAAMMSSSFFAMIGLLTLLG